MFNWNNSDASNKNQSKSTLSIFLHHRAVTFEPAWFYAHFWRQIASISLPLKLSSNELYWASKAEKLRITKRKTSFLLLVVLVLQTFTENFIFWTTFVKHRCQVLNFLKLFGHQKPLDPKFFKSFIIPLQMWK